MKYKLEKVILLTRYQLLWVDINTLDELNPYVSCCGAYEGLCLRQVWYLQNSES